MKTIGLIGGISWHSTSIYYRRINELVHEALGGVASAKIFLHSFNLEEIKRLQFSNDWQLIADMISGISIKLQQSGAECIAICSNTPHLVADSIISNINIPLLHIAESTAKAISNEKIKRVGLIGTRFTMEHSFFQEKLKKYGIETIVPDVEDRDIIHSGIYNELTIGKILPETRIRFLSVIDKLKFSGAEAVIFGCTEISLLLDPEECGVRIFDTTAFHIEDIVKFSLSE